MHKTLHPPTITTFDKWVFTYRIVKGMAIFWYACYTKDVTGYWF